MSKMLAGPSYAEPGSRKDMSSMSPGPFMGRDSGDKSDSTLVCRALTGPAAVDTAAVPAPTSCARDAATEVCGIWEWCTVPGTVFVASGSGGGDASPTGSAKGCWRGDGTPTGVAAAGGVRNAAKPDDAVLWTGERRARREGGTDAGTLAKRTRKTRNAHVVASSGGHVTLLRGHGGAPVVIEFGD